MNSEPTDIAEALEDQMDRLESKLNLLQQFVPKRPWNSPFSVNQQGEEPDWKEFEDRFKAFNQFVYVIRTEEQNESLIYENYKQFKDENKDNFRLSSSNKDIRTKDFKGVLYVGTSSRGMSSFKGRLREHFGIIGPKVYSLQLRHWFKPMPAKIHIEVFTIGDEEKGILYDFENALWDFYEPLFGKKGVNVVSSAGIS